jgi:hypothetical protein
VAAETKLKGRAVGIAALGLGPIAAKVRFKWSAEGLVTVSGFLLRVVNNKNYAAFIVQDNAVAGVTGLSVWTVIGGAINSKVFCGYVTGVRKTTTCTFGVQVVGTQYAMYFGQGDEAPQRFAGELAELGTTLASGTAYLYDQNSAAGAVTRTYDNLGVWAPNPDAILFPNLSARLGSNGMTRKTEDNLAYADIANPGADLPRIPVSGPEERPVEIAIKPSRGDFAQLPDGGLDKVAGQLSYRPCWSGVPEL